MPGLFSIGSTSEKLVLKSTRTVQAVSNKSVFVSGIGASEKRGRFQPCCGNTYLAGLCSLLWKFDVLIFML